MAHKGSTIGPLVPKEKKVDPRLSRARLHGDRPMPCNVVRRRKPRRPLTAEGELSAVSATQVMTSAVEQVLVELGEAAASGCLTVTDAAGEQAEVFFKDGSIYSVFVPGRRVQLGARLIAAGDLSPEALVSALDVQTNELQGWRLGELLVHLGYVDRAVVEAFVVEQLKDAMAVLLAGPSRPTSSARPRRPDRTSRRR